MAYLDNSTITVDAVLTKKGRELLSKGQGAFKITRFALSDDEIDYSLWNPLHPSGSDYYGQVIENMPVLEALIDESQAMRYKLLSIDDALNTANQISLPFISVGYIGGATIANGSTVNINLETTTAKINFAPVTNYIVNGQVKSAGVDSIADGYGYTFIINKSANDIINQSKGMFTSTSQLVGVDSGKITATTQVYYGDGDFTALTRMGKSLEITVNPVAKLITNTTFSLPITIIGNQSGTVFNMILSYSVPAHLRGDIGIL